MNTVYKTTFSILFSLMLADARSQVNDGSFNLLEIQKIAETYRHKPNLSFSVTYTYADSLAPTTILETVNGQIKISNDKTWTLLGNTEIIDGNQYNLTIYHDDSTLVINDKRGYQELTKLPFLDSAYRTANIQSISFAPVSSGIGKITIAFKPASGYSKYSITYDRDTYETQEIVYYVPDAVLASGKGVITLSISNYDSSAPVSLELFNEWKYIYKSNGSFQAQPSYSYFSLVNYSLN